MSIVDYELISPNRTSPRDNEIDTITIHCVVGQCTVEALGKLFANPARRGSSNYGIGYDGKIGLYVPESDRAWTSGGKGADGKTIYINGISGSINDHRAITVEVASDTSPPYAITDAAYESLIKLLVDICKRYPNINRLRWQANKDLVGNVGEQNITAHRWFAATDCPGDYIYTHMSNIVEEVNRRLDNEINKIEEDDSDMTVERFKELWTEMRKDLQDNDAGQWSQEAREWALSSGLIQGSGVTNDGEPNAMWEDLLTREQLIAVLYRFSKIMGSKR